jgi:hypothetical protein
MILIDTAATRMVKRQRTWKDISEDMRTVSVDTMAND